MAHIRIEYEHFKAPNSHLNKVFWAAIVSETREGFDYGKKDYLISQCKKHNHSWEVIRAHRNGKTSVILSGK